MTDRLPYRRLCLALVWAAIPAWLASMNVASLASEWDRPVSLPSGKTGPMVQAAADLTPDLHRLETRRANGEIFDLFSRPVPRASGRTKSSPKTQGADADSGLPPETDRKETSLQEHEPVEEEVVAPAVMASPPIPPASPIAPPPPSPAVAPLPAHPVPPVAAAPPAPPPPPPPKPPALPFTYMGKFEQGSRIVYFLVKADKLYTVMAGEDIDESYFLEGEAGNQLRITYKPLRIAQTLTVGP